ncbi:MAG TPA: HAD family phosphatase [Sediminispirochaeta sp.]|nr:HAD family phosphatase [Sediminispirochaeta sp.]
MNDTEYQAMVVSDFDGTTYHSASGFHPRDLETLKILEQDSFVRVFATGRSMESLRRVIDRSFPIDYVVFSSGAGVYDFKKEELLRRRVLSAAVTEEVCRRLIELKLDFMLHHPIPDNHYFHYYHHGGENPDFFHRMAVYRDFAMPFNWQQVRQMEATQFVVVVPGDPDIHHRIEREFPQLSVIRSTSPLDGRSLWIELFPAGSHKAAGVEWLSRRLGIPVERVMVIGNDFNDLHMLEWARHAFVVDDAPEQLRRRFETVAPCSEAGFSEAVRKWCQG